jgi:hypothetical protein
VERNGVMGRGIDADSCSQWISGSGTLTITFGETAQRRAISRVVTLGIPSDFANQKLTAPRNVGGT